MQEKGLKITPLPFYNQSTLISLYDRRGKLDQWVRLAARFFSHPFQVLKAIGADFVFIHREILPIGPPILEWVLSRVLRKKIIYDFDDAIWLTDIVNEKWPIKRLRWRSKVAQICKWSYKVSVGNEYLARYARSYNSNVIINPTTIDTQHLHNPDLCFPPDVSKEKVTIGWTGSHSTLKYLKGIEAVLQDIERKFPNVTFLIIADRQPSISLQNLEFVKWTKETEVQNLLRMDIGLMPLPDDEWTRGKCGFKALQYMALEIPAVVSLIGVNSEIVDHGINGFLCNSKEEWISKLSIVIRDTNLRMQLGRNGRQKVIKYYSVLSNTSNFLSLFE